MFKKHKQLITGFILGAIVFGTMPVQAKVQEYLLQKSTAKVMVDGKEFTNKELPVLNYKDYNYIPMATFREICDTIGVGFEWVGESGEVRIDTGKDIEKQPYEEVKKPTQENKNVSIIEIEKDGYRVSLIDGVEYITLADAGSKHIKQGYHLDWIPETKEVYLYYLSGPWDKDKEEVLFRNIETQVFQGRVYMEYSYFKENILTLIKNR